MDGRIENCVLLNCFKSDKYNSTYFNILCKVSDNQFRKGPEIKRFSLSDVKIFERFNSENAMKQVIVTYTCVPGTGNQMIMQLTGLIDHETGANLLA